MAEVNKVKMERHELKREIKGVVGQGKLDYIKADEDRARIHEIKDRHILLKEQKRQHRQFVHHLKKVEFHDVKEWEKATKEAKDSSNAVEVDEQTSVSSFGASAIAITGLVIGGSCYMMNKKRQS